MTLRVLLAAPLVLVGCATTPALPTLSPDHPASVLAPESPSPVRSDTLAVPGDSSLSDASAAPPPLAAPPSHGGHGAHGQPK